MNLENNLIMNIPKIKKLEKNIFICNRKVKYIIMDILYFYSPDKIIINKFGKIIIFIKKNKIIIFGKYI